MAVGPVGVLAVAWVLPRADESGRPRMMGTHELLGLPPCSFQRLTGMPCPSCGLTTSFCHFVRGDLVSSLKANAVGTLLAAVGLASIPWCLHGAATGRPWRARRLKDLELGMMIGVIALFALLLVNWVIRLGLSAVGEG